MADEGVTKYNSNQATLMPSITKFYRIIASEF